LLKSEARATAPLAAAAACSQSLVKGKTMANYPEAQNASKGAAAAGEKQQ